MWKILWDNALLMIAAVLIAIGIILIISDDVLGDSTTGIAMILSIIRIGLIPNWKKRKLLEAKNASKET